MYENLFILAVFVLLYSLVSKRIGRLWLSGPIVFTVFGLITGSVGLGLLSFQINGEQLRVLAELTLAIVLFTDASGANLRVLERNRQIPIRLLLVGLPLTIILGIAAGRLLLPGLTLLEIAILATMLAPTDAALGSTVVTDSRVPAAIREGLNVESGLNDGFCVPILLLLLTLAGEAQTVQGGAALAFSLVLREIGIGLGVGLVITTFGAQTLKASVARGWISGAWRQVIVVALALSCFALAQVLGGSGFIASFSGGLLFGALAKRHTEELLGAAEGIGNTFSLATWVVFGAVFVGPALGHLSWAVVAYAVLSLTVVRMLPVFLSLLGSEVPTSGALFMGWFGPRGLASIVFIVMVVDTHTPGQYTLAMTVACTVCLSILAHGISANPLIDALARRSGNEASRS